MITASGLTVQFGQKPLFEDISITFSKSNVYGLIGANGSGKSTFMKVLSGDLDPTSGNVSIQKDRRVSMLSQDQFAFEEKNIIDCVMMGHKKLWSIKQERDRIYALDKMTEEEGLKVSNLEIEFADMNGYSAESDAGELLLGLGISTEEQSLIKGDESKLNEVSQEIADIIIYLLKLADKLNIDIEQAVNDKMEINAKKYPIDLAKGNATKYNKF